MLLAVLFVPYPSNFAGGLRFLGLRFLDLENEDPGQTFGKLRTVLFLILL